MSDAPPRLYAIQRTQCELRHDSLDQLLPPEHPVRDVWAVVAALDLSPLLDPIRAVPGVAGAPAIDPRLLLAVWLQATLDGVGSSRAVARLTEEHLAYRWLCGGVTVGYHTLADFRTGHQEVLNQLLTDTVAALLHAEVIDLTRVAQDGLRVRAAAGASSFRRAKSLTECQEEARQQVQALQTQEGESAQAVHRRSQAAQKRAAAERQARLQAAQTQLQQLQAVNAAQPPSRQKATEQVRVSTTDPECRKMKMADGGFRPAYNVQFATATVGGAIVGVAVTNEGTDGGQLPPMLDQIEARLGRRPREALADNAFATVAAVDAVEQSGTQVYAPPKGEEKKQQQGRDPYERTKADTDATAAWKARMKTAAAKAIYRERASTAEWVNAQARQRGLYQVRVRGQQKVLTVILWYALAHNLRRMMTLLADPAGTVRAARGEEK